MVSRHNISNTSENTPVHLDTSCLCFTHRAVVRCCAGSCGSLTAHWEGMLKLHFGIIKLRAKSFGWDFFEVYKYFLKKLRDGFLDLHTHPSFLLGKPFLQA